ncbi:hypothetical protein BDW62DRAFT_206663 [Aspergillus aurantiobrunneus]
MADFRPFTVYTSPNTATRIPHIRDFEFTFRADVVDDSVQADSNIDGSANHLPPGDPDTKHQQARLNVNPSPPIGETAHGLFQAPDRYVKCARGEVKSFIDYGYAVWVKPRTSFDAKLFYPVRKDHLSELQKIDANVPRVGENGWGFWVREDGVLVFGQGRVLQVFRNVRVALLDVQEDDEDEKPVTGFQGERDPHPPVFRFR